MNIFTKVVSFIVRNSQMNEHFYTTFKNSGKINVKLHFEIICVDRFPVKFMLAAQTINEKHAEKKKAEYANYYYFAILFCLIMLLK